MAEYKILAKKVLPVAVQTVRNKLAPKNYYTPFYDDKPYDSLLQDAVNISLYAHKKLTSQKDGNGRERMIMGEKATILLIASLAFADAWGIPIKLSKGYVKRTYSKNNHELILKAISEMVLNFNSFPGAQEIIEDNIQALIDYVLYTLLKSDHRDKYPLEQACWHIELFI